MPFQQQSTSSQSKSEPHPYIQGDLLGYLDQLRNWYNANPTAPQYQVADPSAAQNSARDAMWGWGTNSLNGLDAAYNPALSYLNDAASGAYYGKGDDIMARKLDAMFRPQAEQFRDIVAPGLQATFGSAGRPGAGLQWANLQNQFEHGLAQTQSDAAAKTAGDVYGMERNLQSQAATALPGVLGQKAGQAQSSLGMLQGVGAADTGDIQKRIDAQRANFYTQPNFWTDMANRNLGMFPGGQTLGSGTSMGWGDSGYGGGGLGSVLGTGMGIAGLGLQAASLFSDERLKKDIKPVGELHDGQTVYSYRYKGAPATHIGLIAQEVERVHPEAVTTHPSGFKMVDYRRAMPPGGLL